jgi:hypothetical protein
LEQYFNESIAELYSKAWSAEFLRALVARARSADWLCTQREVGVVADSMAAVLSAVAGIRRQGHHRVVIKEAFGLAGHNAIRLWEPASTRTGVGSGAPWRVAEAWWWSLGSSA